MECLCSFQLRCRSSFTASLLASLLPFHAVQKKKCARFGRPLVRNVAQTFASPFFGLLGHRGRSPLYSPSSFFSASPNDAAFRVAVPKQALDEILRQTEGRECEYEYFDDYFLYSGYENEPKVGLFLYDKHEISKLVNYSIKYVKAYQIFDESWKFQKVSNGYRHNENGIQNKIILDLRFKKEIKANRFIFKTHRFQYTSKVENMKLLSLKRYEITDSKIHLILPVAGIIQRFKQFLFSTFKSICGLNVALRVVLFVERTLDEDVLQINILVRDFQKADPDCEITLLPVEGSFSRGVAFDYASSALTNDSLMLFCDADMLISEDFVRRCRENTKMNKQVYYPMVFSRFNPDMIESTEPKVDHEEISIYTGHWVHYGFGLVCLYKVDYSAVGGYDLSIKGWGVEDVDLYERHVRSSIRVFRSAEPGLIHVYHDKHCDKKLNEEQYKMCIDTMSESYAHESQLAKKC